MWLCPTDVQRSQNEGLKLIQNYTYHRGFFTLSLMLLWICNLVGQETSEGAFWKFYDDLWRPHICRNYATFWLCLCCTYRGCQQSWRHQGWLQSTAPGNQHLHPQNCSLGVTGSWPLIHFQLGPSVTHQTTFTLIPFGLNKNIGSL